MTFHQQSWSARSGALGDEAEDVFDTVYPKHHKLGLNRPPFQVSGVKLEMRYTPDRMVRERFVEVQGIGSDRTLKLKVEKFDALFMWEHIGPVHLFVWDRTAGVFYEAPIRDWFRACLKHGKLEEFHEGKEYMALKVKDFPVMPQAFQTELSA